MLKQSCNKSYWLQTQWLPQQHKQHENFTSCYPPLWLEKPTLALRWHMSEDYFSVPYWKSRRSLKVGLSFNKHRCLYRLKHSSFVFSLLFSDPKHHQNFSGIHSLQGAKWMSSVYSICNNKGPCSIRRLVCAGTCLKSCCNNPVCCLMIHHCLLWIMTNWLLVNLLSQGREWQQKKKWPWR